MQIIEDLPEEVPPVFTLIPSQANASNVINCTALAGVKAYNAAAAKLVHEFDCESKKCVHLLPEIK